VALLMQLHLYAWLLQLAQVWLLQSSTTGTSCWQQLSACHTTTVVGIQLSVVMPGCCSSVSSGSCKAAQQPECKRLFASAGYPVVQLYKCCCSLLLCLAAAHQVTPKPGSCCSQAGRVELQLPGHVYTNCGCLRC
jgi:hypothetical protein